MYVTFCNTPICLGIFRKVIHMTKNLPLDFINFDKYPDSAFVGYEVFMLLTGLSRTSMWRGIRYGNLPQPIKFSDRKLSFNVGEIRSFLKKEKGEV